MAMRYLEQSGDRGDAAFDGTAPAFKRRCATFLDVLCNDKDLEGAAQFVDDDCILIHDDWPAIRGKAAFLAAWRRNMATMPDYRKEIEDIAAEPDPDRPGTMRLWVYSRITGIPGEACRDSIDMMRFTPDGRFSYSKDVQRPIHAAAAD